MEAMSTLPNCVGGGVLATVLAEGKNSELGLLMGGIEEDKTTIDGFSVSTGFVPFCLVQLRVF